MCQNRYNLFALVNAISVAHARGNGKSRGLLSHIGRILRTFLAQVWFAFASILREVRLELNLERNTIRLASFEFENELVAPRAANVEERTSEKRTRALARVAKTMA